MPSVSIAAGELEQLVTVWKLSGTPDAAGHLDETNDDNWVRIAQRWVKLTPRGSREFFRGQQVAQDITHQVTMRFDSESRTFTEKMQLRKGTRKFNISAPPTNREEADSLLDFPAIEVR